MSFWKKYSCFSRNWIDKCCWLKVELFCFLLLSFAGCCFVTFYTRKAALKAQDALHNIKTLVGVSLFFLWYTENWKFISIHFNSVMPHMLIIKEFSFLFLILLFIPFNQFYFGFFYNSHILCYVCFLSVTLKK